MKTTIFLANSSKSHPLPKKTFDHEDLCADGSVTIHDTLDRYADAHMYIDDMEE